MAVSSSGNYPHANLAGSLIAGMLLAIPAAMLVGKESMWVFLGFFGLFFMVLNETIRRSLALKRLFLSAADMTESVEEAAIRSFFERKVHETADHTGILIYISLLEHKVRVLADSGINARVDEKLWHDLVVMIIDGIREKRQAEAICNAVDRCGSILRQHFPKKSNDRNELGDAMIMGR
jgi:putative membrane protein